VKTQTLFRALVKLVEGRQSDLARSLQISSASLSRHADGLLRKRSVLMRASQFFSSIVSKPGATVVVDDSLLMQPIRAEDLIRLARNLRAEETLKGAK
jgi:hypothetical protein